MANDPLNHRSAQGYAYPGFARWGHAWAKQASDWLFLSDPSVPEEIKAAYRNGQAMAIVRMVTRALDVTATATGTTAPQAEFAPTNGQNYILFWRMATTVVNAGTTSVNSDLVYAKQTDVTGTEYDGQGAVGSLFGSGEMPYVLAVPDYVLGTGKRFWTITNQSGQTVDTHMSFGIAYLDLGTRIYV